MKNITLSGDMHAKCNRFIIYILINIFRKMLFLLRMLSVLIYKLFYDLCIPNFSIKFCHFKGQNKKKICLITDEENVGKAHPT